MLISTAISTKSDVFSYGMVLLELIGGRRNFETIVDAQTRQRKNSYFPKITREKMLEGKLMEVVDKSLANEQIKEEEVEVLVSVAFQCIHESPELRPSMVDVVDMLEGQLPANLPSDSPIFVANFLDVESQASTSEYSFDSDVAETTNKRYETALLSGNTISVRVE
jgi:serine/threonine protein kinase